MDCVQDVFDNCQCVGYDMDFGSAKVCELVGTKGSSRRAFKYATDMFRDVEVMYQCRTVIRSDEEDFALAIILQYEPVFDFLAFGGSVRGASFEYTYMSLVRDMEVIPFQVIGKCDLGERGKTFTVRKKRKKQGNALQTLA
ncbi:uncharacterized protein RAG0_16731 [Rhynchosporium agropyri]|uniref:Uncharacterized protein n=1 Tax=Rhynchosporium agropyri TaxID=914238 RepID=A0A1E1LRN3_9HELO|nr:uncharacterized protein RAG0_16731 [Rhynchosporium agropyri]